MHIVTHYLSGWHLANFVAEEKNHRLAIAIASVVPDIDGIGIIGDFITRNSDNPLFLWSDYHHVLAHNLLFCVLFSLVIWKLNGLKNSLWCFFTLHMHLLMDFLGSKGSKDSFWTIEYFRPFSKKEFVAYFQWELNSPINIGITFILLLLCVPVSRKFFRTPLEWIFPKTDSKIIKSMK